ncbi:MAG TPA: hypothetical protein VMO52_02050 [Acidimicrobiia bacterium]|nr:hypothetical protein [Acidimicrobiia bacterium]
MRLQATLVVTALGLVVAACGVDSGVSETSTTAVEPTTTTTEATIATTTTTVSTTTTVMRGDPVDLGPSAGAELGVVGVAHDDVLNLRAAPGADQAIVDEIPPTYDGLVAEGETRSLPAFWTKVGYEGNEGWVNLRYLAYLGTTDDMTSQVISEMGGRPEAATMTELGRMVAEALSSEDPPSDIVEVVETSVGDLGEVTFDVVGLGDDSVRGLRLHVFGEPSNGGFTLRTVEQTVLCDPTRGVDADGVCV